MILPVILLIQNQHLLQWNLIFFLEHLFLFTHIILFNSLGLLVFKIYDFLINSFWKKIKFSSGDHQFIILCFWSLMVLLISLYWMYSFNLFVHQKLWKKPISMSSCIWVYSLHVKIISFFIRTRFFSLQ
jgi:hypothetical protein